jgi:prepilin-type processing-associated H-X9-DG protein
MAIGVHLFADAHQHFPKGCDGYYSLLLLNASSPVGLSWQTSILPFVEQSALWGKVVAAHLAQPSGYSSEHLAVMATPVKLFVCPGEGRPTATDGFGIIYGLTTYRGVAGTHLGSNDGIFHVDLVVRPTDVTDGLSQTLLIGERPSGPNGDYGGWYANWGFQVCPLTQILPAGPFGWVPQEAVGCDPRVPSFAPGQPDSLCSVGHYWSVHPSGANFALADGSVRFIPYASSRLLPEMATRAGGEIIMVD